MRAFLMQKESWNLVQGMAIPHFGGAWQQERMRKSIAPKDQQKISGWEWIFWNVQVLPQKLNTFKVMLLNQWIVFQENSTSFSWISIKSNTRQAFKKHFRDYEKVDCLLSIMFCGQEKLLKVTIRRLQREF